MKLISEMISYLKQTQLCGRILYQIRIRGINDRILMRLNVSSYKDDVKNPKPWMYASKEYFQKNRKRIKANVDALADTESKRCYAKAIKYRYTHNRKDAPKYTKEHYFIPGIIGLSRDEVFVDCGAYIGDTIVDFYKRVKGNYKRIVALEPDTVCKAAFDHGC